MIIITLIYLLHTGYTMATARYNNMKKYESKYEMLNKVAIESWIYGEYGDGFGKPRNAFFTPRDADNLQRLN